MYEESCPDYFKIQAADLFWYERLWGVLLDRLCEPRGRLLLDYGSGPGFLLKLASRRGWMAYGEEPSEIARDHAKSIGVISAEPGFWNFSFDALISTEVLEHVDDPAETLARMREMLALGGLLALSVPNDENPLQRLFFGRSRPWITPLHKRYFNPRSLKAVVEAAGFEVVWQRTSFPVELLLILPIPRKLAWKLSRIWPAPPFLWRFHIGRHCLLIARKR